VSIMKRQTRMSLLSAGDEEGVNRYFGGFPPVHHHRQCSYKTGQQWPGQRAASWIEMYIDEKMIQYPKEYYLSSRGAELRSLAKKLFLRVIARHEVPWRSRQDTSRHR